MSSTSSSMSPPMLRTSGLVIVAVLLCCCCSTGNAFSTSANQNIWTTTTSPSAINTPSSEFTTRKQTSYLSMKSNDNGNSKKKGGLEEGMRNKLVTESIAPWRTLRLFLYGTLGSSAFVGGLINISGAVANSKINPAEFNLQTELTNIGIDLGAVAIAVALAKFDIDRQKDLQSKVEDKIQRKKEMKQVAKTMKDREKVLRNLPLEITISQDGATQEATVGEMQAGASQHMIIVAGPRKACKDALIGANLLKMDFAMRNVLVVPYEMGSETMTGPTGSGFGDRPSYETQPYIARPVGDGWDGFIADEMNDAIQQGGENVRKEGIALVVARNGKVIRRGVGTVPWREMVEELDQAVNPKGDAGPLPWIAF